jgi:hypothetical protein
MKDVMVKPQLLYIDIGEQSITEWIYKHKYILHSELVRYCESLILNKFEIIEAIIVCNSVDNVVFMVTERDVDYTLNKALEYFLEIEEYEQCGRIRDLLILITNNSKLTENNGRKLEKTNSEN